ncbi:hypothetical protein EEC40_01280 [Neisseria gonorrhoeae]
MMWGDGMSVFGTDGTKSGFFGMAVGCGGSGKMPSEAGNRMFRRHYGICVQTLKPICRGIVCISNRCRRGRGRCGGRFVPALPRLRG